METKWLEWSLEKYAPLTAIQGKLPSLQCVSEATAAFTYSIKTQQWPRGNGLEILCPTKDIDRRNILSMTMFGILHAWKKEKADQCLFRFIIVFKFSTELLAPPFWHSGHVTATVALGVHCMQMGSDAHPVIYCAILSKLFKSSFLSLLSAYNALKWS